MNKRGAGVAFIIAALLFFIVICFLPLGKDVYYNLRDRIYWEELSSKISESQIEEVKLDNDDSLEGDEFKTFIADLGKAGFYRSNWRKEGPTCPIIIVRFSDGSTETFQYWGKGICETSYKKGQFLIKNPELDTIMQKYVKMF